MRRKDLRSTSRICALLDHQFKLASDEAELPTRWQGIPWLTLVLGSGCHDALDSAMLPPEALSDAVRRHAHAVSQNSDGDSTSLFRNMEAIGLTPGSDVSHFVRGIVSDRLTENKTGSEQPELTLEIDPLALDLAAIGCYLTVLYRGIQLASATPFNRNDDNIARIGSGVGDLPNKDLLSDHAKIIDRLSERVIAAADDLQNRFRGKGETSGAQDQPPLDAIDELLGGVVKDLRSRKQIRSESIRYVTDAVWYLLARNAQIYHGWTDLMFEVTGHDDTTSLSHRNPYFSDLRDTPADLLRRLLIGATEHSWSESSSMDAVKATYNSAARVLLAQADAVRSGTPHSSRLPPAACFVTSFDLEVEMALWKRMPDESEFFVVLPVYVGLVASDDSANPCWLRARITKSGKANEDGLDRIRNPESWELLLGSATNDQLQSGPHVVRLCGSPLVELPAPDTDGMAAVRDTLRAAKLIPQNQDSKLSISHAVTINEYVAVRQAEAELLLALTRGQDGIEERVRNRSLPIGLAASSSDRSLSGQNPRYWVGLGVPLSDGAIRHRLISQITAARIWRDLATQRLEKQTNLNWNQNERIPSDNPAAMGLPAEIDRLQGIMVNKRVSEDEALMLSWFGLTSVRDNAMTFVEDLNHYAAHIEALVDPTAVDGNWDDTERAARDTWPRAAQVRCPVSDPRVAK
jgi:hypothetical protein